MNPAWLEIQEKGKAGGRVKKSKSKARGCGVARPSTRACPVGPPTCVEELTLCAGFEALR